MPRHFNPIIGFLTPVSSLFPVTSKMSEHVISQFSAYREPWEGSNCHKAIMFFSDGGTEWPHELSAHLCNETTEDCVRVFTFGCGPHPIPTVILKSMACKTRGYFSSITALGAIQNRIQVCNF